MDREKRFLTWRRPSKGCLNLMHYPKIAKKFASEFKAMGFNWIPTDVDVEYDESFASEFEDMERRLWDNPDMIFDNMLPLILDTAIQFYLRGWVQARSDKYLYRKEYYDESNNYNRQTD